LLAELVQVNALRVPSQKVTFTKLIQNFVLIAELALMLALWVPSHRLNSFSINNKIRAAVQYFWLPFFCEGNKKDLRQGRDFYKFVGYNF